MNGKQREIWRQIVERAELASRDCDPDLSTEDVPIGIILAVADALEQSDWGETADAGQATGEKR